MKREPMLFALFIGVVASLLWLGITHDDEKAKRIAAEPVHISLPFQVLEQFEIQGHGITFDGLVIYDPKRKVTCWIYQNAISCLPDGREH